jgi:hypothetical protein
VNQDRLESHADRSRAIAGGHTDDGKPVARIISDDAAVAVPYPLVAATRTAQRSVGRTPPPRDFKLVCCRSYTTRFTPGTRVSRCPTAKLAGMPAAATTRNLTSGAHGTPRIAADSPISINGCNR